MTLSHSLILTFFLSLARAQYYITFRHLVARSRVRQAGAEGGEEGASGLERRHSIDVPHLEWRKRYLPHLPTLQSRIEEEDQDSPQ